MSMQSLNIALVFAPDDAARIAAYSQALAPLIQSDYIIGVNSLPHVTLLQVGSEAGTLIAVIQAMGTGGQTYTVTTTELYRHRGSGGQSWYGLGVQAAPLWRDLPVALWEALGRPDQHNPIGENYFPHITTGHGAAIDPVQMPDATPLQGTYQTRLAVGVSGPKYQLTHTLWQAAEPF
jgi:hypothetical protein